MRSANSENVLVDFSIANCVSMAKKGNKRGMNIEFDQIKNVPNLKNFLVEEFEGEKKHDFKLKNSYLGCLLLSLFNFH